MASIIGWISLGMGFALTLATLRSAALLGWGTRGRLARAIGASDLIVGLGLLLDRRRSRWMVARAVLNAVLAGSYARVLAVETPRQTRARRSRLHDRPDHLRLHLVAASSEGRDLVVR